VKCVILITCQVQQACDDVWVRREFLRPMQHPHETTVCILYRHQLFWAMGQMLQALLFLFIKCKTVLVVLLEFAVNFTQHQFYLYYITIEFLKLETTDRKNWRV
jgi:hypothetical protein